MRFIENPDQLPFPPRACAVTNRDRGDFVDLQVVIDRPMPTRLYLLKEVVEDAGRLVGMVPAREVEELKERLVTLGEEMDDLRETAELTTRLDEKLAGKETVPA